MQYLIAPILGALMVLAFAPFAWYPFSVACPTLLFFLWLRGSPRTCAVTGFLFGLGLFGAGVSWVYVSLHVYGNMPVPLAGVTVAVFVVYLSLFPTVVGAVQAWVPVPVWARGFLLIPAMWSLAEWLRGWLLTGFPWLSLGYSQADWPLMGMAPVVGVYGVSLASAIVSGALAAALSRPRTLMIPALSVVIVVSLSGWFLGRVEWVTPLGEPRRVALVQGNVPLAEKWDRASRPRILQRYLGLSDNLNSDLVVWPESALPYYIDELPNDFWQRLAQHPADFVFGVLERRPQGISVKLYNSVVSVSKSRSFYRKRHLVPFGEYLPLASLLSWLLDYLNIPMSDFSSWPDRQAPPTAAGMPLGVSVCYEDAFPEQVRAALPNATVLVNVSEDAWFGDSLAPHQRLQMARMRAIEMGRPMLRAANTGVSAVIDHRGEIIAQSPQFAETVVQSSVQPMQGVTPYVRFGNLIMLMVSALALLLAAVLSRRAARGSD